MRFRYALAEIEFEFIMIGEKDFSKRCCMRAAVGKARGVVEWPRK
jgi:hypothetical protein